MATIASLETWRKPDDSGERWAVWYGPAGEEGDVASAASKLGGYQYRFGEIQDVEGLIEEPPDRFLVTSVTVDLDEAVRDALRIDLDDARERLDQVPEEKKLRMAAAFASALIPKFGGSESWASSLADGVSEIT